VQLANAADADDFAEEVTALEAMRIEANMTDSGDKAHLDIAQHSVLKDFMRCRPFKEGGAHGVEFHRYWVGATMSIDEHGQQTMSGADTDDPLIYTYQILPLAPPRLSLGSGRQTGLVARA
jgi:hypothetical protein